jgi:cellulose synthase/poly-beta-1,6-N-acetylglucosamine synthase-like glycosyltransferase
VHYPLNVAPVILAGAAMNYVLNDRYVFQGPATEKSMEPSIVIAAHNEVGSIAKTVESLIETLYVEKLDHEVLVVNDNSTDQTEPVLQDLQSADPTLCNVS